MAAAALLALGGLTPVARAAASDPAAAQIESFDSALIDTMKSGLGVQARYRKLEPVVERTFDIPTMTRFAVGPTWSTLSPAEQQALIQAFTRLTIASWAHNFASYSGQRFDVSPNVVTRGPDKVVTTTLVSPHDDPVTIAYRMRQSAGGPWKVIDVYYNGAISQLTTRRADFQSPLQHGGPSALVAHLNALVDKEMK
jgi:phospholipid transport system substrate-binding protein